MGAPGERQGRFDGLPGSVAALLVLALVAVTALEAVAWLTRVRIARNEAAQIMKVLRTVLPAGSYDNEPDADRILLREPALLGSDEALPIYRARLHGEPTAAVVTVVARQGYTGPIRLLVAIGTDGRILGVRTLAHQETPGVGDRIDPARSDWLGRFRGRSLAATPLERWAVRRDGGEFDQLTGATVTSRAVVNAVRDAALLFQARQKELFERPAE